MEEKSKSARKRELDALRSLAISMTKLSEGQREKLNLPEPLHEAIQDYIKMNKRRNFSALRRQAKYLGRVLSDEAPEFLAKLSATLKKTK